jgi:DNA-binding NarL/FixJ family response regulator
MTDILVLEKSPLLAVGMRSTLEQMTDWRVQSARQDLPVVAQLVQDARYDVTILDDTTGEVRDLFGQLGKQRVSSLGMTLVVTAAPRSEETLFHLALWGVAAYLSAELTPDAFVDAVRRASTGEWMLTDEGLARPPRRHEPQLQGTAPACANTNNALLSPREIDVLTCVAQGKSNKEVARSLLVSDQTIKNHLTAIYKKLAVTDRTTAVIAAIRSGLIKMPAGPTPTPALYAAVA